MRKWKLYWAASDGLEDCFVVAKNSRSAKRIEKDMNGFEDQDLRGTRIMDIPDEYEMIANKRFQDWSKEHDCNKRKLSIASTLSLTESHGIITPQFKV